MKLNIFNSPEHSLFRLSKQADSAVARRAKQSSKNASGVVVIKSHDDLMAESSVTDRAASVLVGKSFLDNIESSAVLGGVNGLEPGPYRPTVGVLLHDALAGLADVIQPILHGAGLPEIRSWLSGIAAGAVLRLRNRNLMRGAFDHVLAILLNPGPVACLAIREQSIFGLPTAGEIFNRKRELTRSANTLHGFNYTPSTVGAN